MTDDFRLSVVVPTYNRAPLLVETLESVFAQSVPCHEVIVVDDGSTDDTPEIVRRWGDRLTYVSQENRGVAAARNHGLKLSKGNWVTFLDSDDLWCPEKVARDREAWKRFPQAQVFFTGSRTLRGKILGPARVPAICGDVLTAMSLSNFLCAGSVVARRECWFSVGGFEQARALGPSADWDLWVRLAARYPFTPTGAASLWVREHSDNMMHDPVGMESVMAAAVDHFLADPVAGPRLEPIAARIRGRSLLFSAVSFYGSGDTAACRHRLRLARATDPSVVLHPLWSYTFVRSLLGRRASTLLRCVKRSLSGLVGARHKAATR